VPITVAVDAMGGDHGPSTTLRAALKFLEETPDARVIAVGQEAPLRAAIARNPGFAAAFADLGWALLALGRATEAEQEFARALELDPLHALPRRQLAWRDLLERQAAG